MNKAVYVFSGPCGCGKSTCSELLARRLVEETDALQAYVIHGDDYHRNLITTREWVGPDRNDFMYWRDILPFIWECMCQTADSVLGRGVPVILDYVVEDELPLLFELAKKHQAPLYYVVLTADEEVLKTRLEQRGSAHLAERSLFLKSKLENLPENRGHILDTTHMTPDDVAAINMSNFRCDM